MSSTAKLSLEAIRQQLSPSTAAHLSAIHCVDCTDSTNTHLLQRLTSTPGRAQACLADQQTAGRGRSGRAWYSPPSANLYLSLLWWFKRPLPELGGLSLVGGVAVAQVLSALGLAVKIKWPNDILHPDGKLAGILVECGLTPRALLSPSLEVASYGVIGIGLNVAMPQEATALIDQPWTDLRRQLPYEVDRNTLAAQLLEALSAALSAFDREGLATIAADWQRFDATAHRPVVVKLPTGVVEGMACGVDDSGALLVATAAGVQRFVAGEVSLRLQPSA